MDKGDLTINLSQYFELHSSFSQKGDCVTYHICHLSSSYVFDFRYQIPVRIGNIPPEGGSDSCFSFVSSESACYLG